MRGWVAYVPACCLVASVGSAMTTITSRDGRMTRLPCLKQKYFSFFLALLFGRCFFYITSCFMLFLICSTLSSMPKFTMF